MDYLLFFLLSVTLLVTLSSSGADEVTHITATKGEDCTLEYSKNTTLKLCLLEWSRSDLDKRLLVFRGSKVQEGYEDPDYTNRVELLDPELQTELSVVLKNVSEKDSGEYRCMAVYEDGQTISQFIHLNVTEPETTSIEAHKGIKTETNTEIETETNTEPSLGLILGLVFGLFALILIALCVWFRKQIEHKLFDSSECSRSEELKKPPIPRSSSSSSSSASSTLSHGSDAPLIKTPPSSGDTEQASLKPPLYSESCPPSSPPLGTPFLGGEKHLSALSVTSAPSWSCHLDAVEGLECCSPGSEPGLGSRTGAGQRAAQTSEQRFQLRGQY